MEMEMDREWEWDHKWEMAPSRRAGKCLSTVAGIVSIAL